MLSTDLLSGPDASPRTRGVLGLAALLAGALISWGLLATLLVGPERNFEELALGRETQSHFATVDGRPIHCTTPELAQPCLDGHAARGGRPVVLWLGNSQLHAINQKHTGDRTAPEILHHELDEAGLDVLAFSVPNAGYQELLTLFLYLSDRLPIRRVIVLLVFDDFREAGLRAGFAVALGDPAVVAALEASEAGRAVLGERSQQAQGSLAALEGTVQERSEAILDGWLDAHWKLWALRARARGTLLAELHHLRNTVFGITPQSKRPLIPGRFRLNLDAVAAVLEEAGSREIAVVTYIVPLRDDVPSPYVSSEYEEFKQVARRTAAAGGAVFADLESLVPAESWGVKDATTIDGGVELDFMHFQGSGHELLADAVRRARLA